MKKLNQVLIITDSFKGSASSETIGKLGQKLFNTYLPNIKTQYRSIADGGEGTVDFFINEMGYIKKEVKSCNAFLEPLTTYYAVKGNKAVFDVAQIVGFQNNHYLNIDKATTYGIGLVLQKIIDEGYDRIYLGLGGSITNDGGSGILEALGAKFYYQNQPITIHQNPHQQMDKIEYLDVLEKFKSVQLIALCDVTNPLLGENGATYIYSPQKGATSDDLPILEKWMENYSKCFKTDVSTPGAGAAGGIGFLIKSIGGELKKGIEVLLDELKISELIDSNTLVITGEGKLDKTSFSGKVVGELIKLTNQKNNELAIICGVTDYQCFDNLSIYPLHQEVVTNYKETVILDLTKAFTKIIKDYLLMFDDVSLIKTQFDNPIYRKLRSDVFINEQHVDPSIEFDDLEVISDHYLLMFQNQAIGCCRLLDNDGETKLGRFLIIEKYRNMGFGKQMVKEIVKVCKAKKWQEIVIHAQVQAKPFYLKCGFVSNGDEFEEANILHQKMFMKL